MIKLMNFLKRSENGFAQLVVLGLMALVAVALPVTTKLVQKNQENRSRAAENINIPATGITMDLESPVYMGVGETLMMKYHLIPANSTDKVIWSITEGEDIATVDVNGFLKALKPGKVSVLGLTSTDKQFALQDVIVTDENVGRVGIFYNLRGSDDYRTLTTGMDIVSELRLNTFGKVLSSAEIVYYHTDALEPYLDGVTGEELIKVISHKKDGGWNSLKVEFDKSKKPSDSVYVLKIKTKILKNINNASLEVYKGLSLYGSNGIIGGTEIVNDEGNRMNIIQVGGTNFTISDLVKQTPTPIVTKTIPSLTPTMGPITSVPFLFLRSTKNIYSIGQTFSAIVGVNSGNYKIGGVDGVMSYDSSILSLLSIKKSSSMVFKNAGDNCVVGDISPGKISFVCFSTDSSKSIVANGELMVLNFLVKKNIDSKIIFECTSGSTIESNIVSDGRDVINCGRNVGLSVLTSGGALATPTPLPRPTSVGSCTNNSDRCNGNNYQVCNNGTWITYQVCQSGCDVQRKICILPATSVAITSSTMTMKIGESFQFKAQIAPTTSTDRVFWHVSVPAAYGAIISADTNTGLITALGEGQFTIMAKAMDANGNIRDDIRSKEVVVKIVKTIAVDGKCGSARNACISGAPNNGALADTSSEYRWKCLSLEGGRDANCSLKKSVTPTAVLRRPVDGKCGSKRNTCTSGSVSIMVTSSTLYQWRCVGRDGGKTVICSIRR